LPHILTLESVTVKPTPKDPHNSRVVYSFVVPKQLCNMGGNLHGGAVALIFDICTSTAITAVSRDGFWDTGTHLHSIQAEVEASTDDRIGHVSRNLNCTYLRPAPEGAKVYVISEVVHLGKRQGLTKGEIRMESEDGKIAYTCEHGKAAVGSSSL
jgi:acyl-coenzyme A thioesterase 13